MRRGEAAVRSNHRRAGSGITSTPGAPPLGHDYAPSLVDQLRETQAAMLNAVLAGHGLGAIAELASARTGAAVAIVVPGTGTAIAPADDSTRADATALSAWVGELVKNRAAATPPGVLDQVPIRLRDETVGVVALLRSDGKASADASEFLHPAATATITEVAIARAREAVEQDLRGSFLEELVTRQDLSTAEIVRRAARLGCDLSQGALVLCVELSTDRPRLVAATIAQEHPGALADRLDGVGGAGPRVYAVLPAIRGDGATTTLASAKRLAARMRPYGAVGISSFYSDPSELGSAAREAELVLDVLRSSGAPLSDEIAGGTYKLLLRVLASHPEELRIFYETTIASLVRYDDQYRTELVRTLQTYLDTNCNMNQTATAIFAHRHTIAYRLERIRELTQLDPMLSEDRERLGLSLKVHRLIASRLPR